MTEEDYRLAREMTVEAVQIAQGEGLELSDDETRALRAIWRCGLPLAEYLGEEPAGVDAEGRSIEWLGRRSRENPRRNKAH